MIFLAASTSCCPYVWYYKSVLLVTCLFCTQRALAHKILVIILFSVYNSLFQNPGLNNILLQGIFFFWHFLSLRSFQLLFVVSLYVFRYFFMKCCFIIPDFLISSPAQFALNSRQYYLTINNSVSRKIINI